MHAELLVLRFLHIVCGILWVGGAVLMGLFVFPSVQEAGPAGGQVMQGMLKRKVPVIMPVLAIVTILAGARLMWRVSAGFAPGYFSSPVGRTFGVAAAIAILALLHGLASARPIANKIGAVMAQMQQPGANKEALGAEAKTLQAKLGKHMKITAVLLLLSAAGMSLARYM
jgi:hypothetical protein